MKFFCQITLFFLLLTSRLVSAHPHSFIDIDASLIIEKQSLVAIKMVWEMDELTSAELLLDAQSAKDDPTVWQGMADELMENTQNQLYFTEINVNGKAIQLAEKATNYSLHRQDNKAIFTFVLPLEKPQPLLNNTLTISTYEQSFYVDMRYPAQSSIHLAENMREKCQVSLLTPEPSPSLIAYALSLDKDDSPGEDMALGSKFAQTVTLTCK